MENHSSKVEKFAMNSWCYRQISWVSCHHARSARKICAWRKRCMKSGVCLKCGSKDIYHRTSDIAGNTQNQINIKSHLWAAPEYFVCATCGYLGLIFSMKPDWMKSQRNGSGLMEEATVMI